MLKIRQAVLDDLDFLVKADLSGDGYAEPATEMTEEELQTHREKIGAFVIDNGRHGAWVCVDSESDELIGMILCRFRQWNPLNSDEFESDSVFHKLPDNVFPRDGRFCEVFQLWVDERYRRRGLGTRLKEQLEHESRRRGIKMIYTHTEEENLHVLELNRRLGYEEVRRGPIWDDAIRVSLVKRLGMRG